MVFSSPIFLFVFLPLLLLMYFITRKLAGHQASNLILLAGSMFFILWGSGKDILVLLAVIFINYIAGLVLDKVRERGRKITLAAAVAVSLGMLLFFKYSGFIAEIFTNLQSMTGLTWEAPEFVSKVVLPLGISFYTFQALSYTIDVYYRKVDSTKSLIDFSLYVSFFPQLIAGPIVRYKDIYRQLKERKSDVNHIFEGMTRFMMGMSKKILLANTVAKAADGIFALPVTDLHPALAWSGILAYTLQIYLDFSAYSDMAIGLAGILGFDLLENFNFPYTAQSVRDFWKRWHISLSTWLRDYLYIPLGGSRNGNIRTYLNLIIVFFLCGLWHGSAWTFVLWGLWHGMFLLIERAFLGKVLEKIPRVIRHIYTLSVVIFGWILFRSNDISYAMAYTRSMFGSAGFDGKIIRTPLEFVQGDVIIAAVFGVLASMGLFSLLRQHCSKRSASWQNMYTAVIIIVFLLSVAGLYSGAYNPFIYFRF